MKHSFYFLVIILLGFTSCKKEIKETPLTFGTVSDIDGNTYKTVKIGNQWWMCQNLRTKRFLDGSPILDLSTQGSDSLWAATSSSALTYIDSLNGVQYNQFAVQDARKIAPAGWHIPSDEEWKILEKTIGMNTDDADQLAWRGTNEAEKLLVKNSEGWPLGTVVFGLNTYEFAILPMGCRTVTGSAVIGYNAFFWSSSQTSNGQPYYRYFDYQKKNIFRQTTYPQYGMSIRCVKD